MNKNKPIIGITIGDINGIGPEVIIKSLEDNRILEYFTPVIYTSVKIISFYQKVFHKNNFNYRQINSIEKIVPEKINILNVWHETIEIKPGEANETGGKYAVLSLEKAVADLKKNCLDAIVTASIDKNLVQGNNFHFPGHTEYLTKEAGKTDSLMFLVHQSLRVGIVTGHIALHKVSENITKTKIVKKVHQMIQSLQKDFGINKPKIAVLGLNPHAGENGLFGDEEKKVIIPAINELKNKHYSIVGPFSSDGFFGNGTYKQFDGVLAMYHDQGLIPFKTLTFGEGVNYTAGLPFIRTSPDHGTAFPIAGKNEANGTSFRNALYLANDIIRQRNKNQVTENN